MQGQDQKPPAEKVITLEKPIEFGGGLINELRLREPTAGELKQVRAVRDEYESNLLLISLVTGIAPPALDKLGVSLIEEAIEYLAGFTRAGRKSLATI